MTTVDLNCDMGEGFGPWAMGDDAAMLEIVTSANVACGFHAGDPLTMARTMSKARDRGVRIGAHPGFADLQGFGRREMAIPGDEIAAVIRYQLGAACGMARALGPGLAHVKLHGALANMASRDVVLATLCFEAARSVDPDLPLMVIAGTAQAVAARAVGGPMISEIFADRGYEPDGTLTPRDRPGAVLHDPESVATRVVRMVTQGAIESRTGTLIPVSVDTICLHGDTPGAVALARAVRAALEAAGHSVQAPAFGAVSSASDPTKGLRQCVSF